jgi:hypothetical protein
LPGKERSKNDKSSRVGVYFGVIGAEEGRLDLKRNKLLRLNLNKLETSQIFLCTGHLLVVGNHPLAGTFRASINFRNEGVSRGYRSRKPFLWFAVLK